VPLAEPSREASVDCTEKNYGGERKPEILGENNACRT
jgi:hypothetical protein